MEDLISLRKELHQYPETSGNEKKTAIRIQNFLKQYAPSKLHVNIGGNGVLAIYEGTEKGKTILLRCELDALPIQEINTFYYRSKIDNVSHKCGHDGHMTILCGVAKQLFEQPLKKGNVILLFQPAEENGTGAKAVLEDAIFKTINPNYVFALHNLPGYSKNQIVVKSGTFTSAVNSIIIKLFGKTSHAGEPEKGNNPAMAISGIISSFALKVQPNIHKEKYCLITPIYLEMGEKAYGVSAGYGEVHFTVRSDQNNFMEQIENELETKAKAIAKHYNLQPEITWTESFKANENDKDAVHFIRTAAKKSQLSILEKEVPFSFGEDFGLFTQHYKGALFGLGSGETIPALHNPDYDFPDEIITTGISIFYNLSKDILDA